MSKSDRIKALFQYHCACKALSSACSAGARADKSNIRLPDSNIFLSLTRVINDSPKKEMYPNKKGKHKLPF